jgi:hypothetical protein
MARRSRRQEAPPQARTFKLTISLLTFNTKDDLRAELVRVLRYAARDIETRTDSQRIIDKEARPIGTYELCLPARLIEVDDDE